MTGHKLLSLSDRDPGQPAPYKAFSAAALIRQFRRIRARFEALHPSPRAIAKRWAPQNPATLERQIKQTWPPSVDRIIEVLETDLRVTSAKGIRSQSMQLLPEARRVSAAFAKVKSRWLAQAEMIVVNHARAQTWLRKTVDSAYLNGGFSLRDIGADFGISKSNVVYLMERDWRCKPKTILKYLQRAAASDSEIPGIEFGLEQAELLVAAHTKLQLTITQSIAENRNRGAWMFGAGKNQISERARAGWSQKTETLVRWIDRIQLR